MEGIGPIREYYGILINQSNYVKIYASSKEMANRLFTNEYGYNDAGKVYTTKEFDYYKQLQYKDYEEVDCLGRFEYLQKLRERRII